eukprot:1005601-Alexandrium_andersonii.AAC.1
MACCRWMVRDRPWKNRSNPRHQRCNRPAKFISERGSSFLERDTQPQPFGPAAQPAALLCPFHTIA